MENFVFQNTTKIIFGKDTHKVVAQEIKVFSSKILFVYGGGSIKRFDIYSDIIQELDKQNITFFELPNIKSNPQLGRVREGIEICRKEGLNFILAAGGASVIDTAKAVALGVCYHGDVWDFFIGKAVPKLSLPVGVILTIPGAGSEASDATVITNEDFGIKKSVHNNIIRPKFSILNPDFTYSLNSYQLFCGISDTIAHILERYFTPTGNVDLTDRLCEGAVKSVMDNALLILKKPEEYYPRAEIMWASTIAHNDILSTGRTGDWACHKISHAISAVYDTAHGATFSVIFPAWMKYVYKHGIKRFIQFAYRIFNIDPCFGTDEQIIFKGIERLEEFYRMLGLPLTLREISVAQDKFDLIADKSVEFGAGKFIKLEKDDILKILKLADY